MDTKYHYDELEDKLIIEKVQDVEPILEANKKALNEDNNFTSEVFNHVARIPIVCIEKWCNEKGIKYNEFMGDTNLLKLFLNDPDNKFLRTKAGRI